MHWILEGLYDDPEYFRKIEAMRGPRRSGLLIELADFLQFLLAIMGCIIPGRLGDPFMEWSIILDTVIYEYGATSRNDPHSRMPDDLD